MPRQRSPNYPSVDLGTAVEAAKALHQREGRAPVPPEVAVKAWGFTALSGNARTRLAAVRQYGLIESDRQGNVRLTPRGLDLAVANPSSPEYAQALREGALAPDIFRELHETRQGASDDSLRHYLIVGRRFSSDGADRLIESFRSTMVLANLDNRGYDEDMESQAGNETNSLRSAGGRSGGEPHGNEHPPLVHPLLVRDEYRWPLYEDVVAEVTFLGGAVTPDDVELLQEYLDTVKKARGRATRPTPTPSQAAFSQSETDGRGDE